jgi:hypothetical protein
MGAVAKTVELIIKASSVAIINLMVLNFKGLETCKTSSRVLPDKFLFEANYFGRVIELLT